MPVGCANELGQRSRAELTGEGAPHALQQPGSPLAHEGGAAVLVGEDPLAGGHPVGEAVAVHVVSQEPARREYLDTVRARVAQTGLKPEHRQVGAGVEGHHCLDRLGHVERSALGVHPGVQLTRHVLGVERVQVPAALHDPVGEHGSGHAQGLDQVVGDRVALAGPVQGIEQRAHLLRRLGAVTLLGEGDRHVLLGGLDALSSLVGDAELGVRVGVGLGPVGLGGATHELEHGQVAHRQAAQQVGDPRILHAREERGVLAKAARQKELPADAALDHLALFVEPVGGRHAQIHELHQKFAGVLARLHVELDQVLGVGVAHLVLPLLGAGQHLGPEGFERPGSLPALLQHRRAPADCLDDADGELLEGRGALHVLGPGPCTGGTLGQHRPADLLHQLAPDVGHVLASTTQSTQGTQPCVQCGLSGLRGVTLPHPTLLEDGGQLLTGCGGPQRLACLLVDEQLVVLVTQGLLLVEPALEALLHPPRRLATLEQFASTQTQICWRGQGQHSHEVERGLVAFLGRAVQLFGRDQAPATVVAQPGQVLLDERIELAALVDHALTHGLNPGLGQAGEPGDGRLEAHLVAALGARNSCPHKHPSDDGVLAHHLELDHLVQLGRRLGVLGGAALHTQALEQHERLDC